MLLLTEFRVSRAINRRDIAKNTIFNMAAVRHIGFVVTSSYFIRVLSITFLTLCYIFILIGLVFSDILGVSCFIILAGNCLFKAKFLGFWGVNRVRFQFFI